MGFFELLRVGRKMRKARLWELRNHLSTPTPKTWARSQGWTKKSSEVWEGVAMRQSWRTIFQSIIKKKKDANGLEAEENKGWTDVWRAAVAKDWWDRRVWEGWASRRLLICLSDDSEGWMPMVRREGWVEDVALWSAMMVNWIVKIDGCMKM